MPFILLDGLRNVLFNHILLRKEAEKNADRVTIENGIFGQVILKQRRGKSMALPRLTVEKVRRVLSCITLCACVYPRARTHPRTCALAQMRSQA